VREGRTKGKKMQSVEIQAQTTEEAVRLALEQLGRTRNEVNIEVLSGGREDDDEVLVKVSIKPEILARIQAAGSRPLTPGGADSTPLAEGGRRGPVYGTPAPAAGSRFPAPQTARAWGTGQRRDDRPNDRRGGSGGYGRGRDERRSGGGGGYGRGEQRGGFRSDFQGDFHGTAQATLAEYENESAQMAGEMLEDLLDLLDIPAKVAQRDSKQETPEGMADPKTLVLEVFDVDNADKGLLIGKHGDNLSALQFVMNVILHKKLKGWERVVIDVEGYRVRRTEQLANLALRLAERVVESGEPHEMEPLPPAERRIVHLALQENRDVYTESTGEGKERRVVIMLKGEDYVPKGEAAEIEGFVDTGDYSNGEALAEADEEPAQT
jgi:spoIIIJ-associated protein